MNGYIIDLDGTVLDGCREINQAGRFIKYLQDASVPFLLATNSIKSPGLQMERLLRAGIELASDAIYSPIDSINSYLRHNGIGRVLAVGSDSEVSRIKAGQSEESPELVILLDFEKRNASYRDLQKIVDYILAGVPVVTASGSPYYLRGGKKQIDTGAFVKLIESVTAYSIPVLGKPSREYYQNALSRLGSLAEECIAVGDDWSTDIQGAKEAGLRSVLIASGKYRPGDELKGKPDYLIRDFTELTLS